MTWMAKRWWWPYMIREHIVKSTDCKSCTASGKNLKSVIPPGPIFDERGTEINVSAAIDRFLNIPTARFYEKTSGLSEQKILDMYIENHGNPQSSILSFRSRKISCRTSIKDLLQ